MRYTQSDVLDFVRENDVKFIRLAFCDLFGTQKNISITAQELPRAFDGGISFDASAVEGFLNVDRSDLFLFPEPDTLAVLPWRPGRGRTARLFCEIRHPDGAPFEGDGRYLLRRACERAGGMGYLCQIGPECEFYLFELDEKGNPSTLPIDNAGYLDVAPADRGENVRRDICLTLEEMGIVPESFHHEQGPGQNEIDFRYSDALTAADQLVTFKGAVRTIAAQNGMYASFLPKPMLDCPGSGMHVNMSLLKDGCNIFQNVPGKNAGEAGQFLAGLLLRVREITALLNPLTNSYRRFGSFEAPRYVTWSHSNRSQLIRIPAMTGEYTRIELRSPDPACNPYFAFALLIHAGLDGIEGKLSLPEPCERDLYRADPALLERFSQLPCSLGEALDLLEGSEFARRVIPGDTLDKFIRAKRRAQAAVLHAEDPFGLEHRTDFLRY